jgi:hypothetical protein
MSMPPITIANKTHVWNGLCYVPEDDAYNRAMGIFPMVEAPPARLGSGVPCPHCDHGTRGDLGRCNICARWIGFTGGASNG